MLSFADPTVLASVGVYCALKLLVREVETGHQASSSDDWPRSEDDQDPAMSPVRTDGCDHQTTIAGLADWNGNRSQSKGSL
jgi:hypothetical protein